MTGPGEMRLYDMTDEPARDEQATLLEQPLASGVGVVRGDLAGNVLAIVLDRKRLPQIGPDVLTAQLTEAIQRLQGRATETRMRIIQRRNRKI